MGSSRLLVADHQFILATRDTGYRSLANAVAELVDNSVQAEATCVRVFVRDAARPADSDVAIAVLDNGHGMDRNTVWTALQFGGTERFGDRHGLGRFGMGLPNSSVSQSRRVEVYSWRTLDQVLFSYLDVDAVARGELRRIPPPARRALPKWAASIAAPSGTLVLWNRCDRLTFRRAPTIAHRLRRPLGRIYRELIWRGLRLFVNDDPVAPVDPLHFHAPIGEAAAVPYGAPLIYELEGPGAKRTSTVTIRFSELPIALWHDLPVDEKRARGIVGGAGVSFVRAGREIDYGWHLMGTKRKENYDDWWRCEITFAPELDELFGVTHSKQGVTPTAQLEAVLAPELEAIARTLNVRVRRAFEALKRREPSRATVTAGRQEALLPPLPTINQPKGRARRQHAYSIVAERLRCHAFFKAATFDGTLTVTLNSSHPFYERIYAPALAARDEQRRHDLESLILAAARAELTFERTADRTRLERYGAAWGDALAAFLERRV
ncbi:MAG TPA: ATP-binding protein [Gemmatimonadales bacterium]